MCAECVNHWIIHRKSGVWGEKSHPEQKNLTVSSGTPDQVICKRHYSLQPRSRPPPSICRIPGSDLPDLLSRFPFHWRPLLVKSRTTAEILHVTSRSADWWDQADHNRFWQSEWSWVEGFETIRDSNQPPLKMKWFVTVIWVKVS